MTAPIRPFRQLCVPDTPPAPTRTMTPPHAPSPAFRPCRRSSAYSAPELVRQGRSSPAGDVYALAVVLWELAWGRPLPALLARPQGAGLQAWLAEQTHMDYAEAGALPPELLPWPEHVPPAYAALVAECLRERPAERPSAAEVGRRLGEVRQGVVVAPAPSVSPAAGTLRVGVWRD